MNERSWNKNKETKKPTTGLTLRNWLTLLLKENFKQKGKEKMRITLAKYVNHYELIKSKIR